MPSYVVWYKKELKAKDISEAVKKEKKLKAKFSSIHEDPDVERELPSLIGFNIYTESDYE